MSSRRVGTLSPPVTASCSSGFKHRKDLWTARCAGKQRRVRAGGDLDLESQVEQSSSLLSLSPLQRSTILCLASPSDYLHSTFATPHRTTRNWTDFTSTPRRTGKSKSRSTRKASTLACVKAAAAWSRTRNWMASRSSTCRPRQRFREAGPGSGTMRPRLVGWAAVGGPF